MTGDPLYPARRKQARTMPAPKTVFHSPRSVIAAGTATIPGLYEWNAQENAQYPVFRFHDHEGLKTITYAGAILAIRRVARYVRSFVKGKERVPVAILANVGELLHSF